MIFSNNIGVDPDSKGFECACFNPFKDSIKRKFYLACEEGMQKFIKWTKGLENVCVAIEGSNGQSKPMEKVLRENKIEFYSFKPSAVDKFRKAVLGQNKNNKKDAEATARFAVSLASMGELKNFKRLFYPNEKLQLLTRTYERENKQLTKEINAFWKTLKVASSDLYIAFKGHSPDAEINPDKILKKKGILNLLANKPELNDWKQMDEAQFLKAMGGRNYKGRKQLIKELQKVAANFKPVGNILSLIIEKGATKILYLKKNLEDIEKLLERTTQDNKAVQALKEFKGISTITASIMVAEIINIKRFKKNDNLASYSGLGMRQHSTGDKNKMIPNKSYNHRIKNAFMAAAGNFVLHNRDSHLTGFHKNLIKDGMHQIEARKRVARALVRKVFKKLDSISSTNTKESDMAETNKGLSEINHYSNISLSSEIKSDESKKAS